MRNQWKLGWMIAGCVCLCACSNNQPQGSVSGDRSMSVSEEIAAELSENSIPVEAMEFITLDYQVPEGFTLTEGSSDTQAVYVSDTLDDYSYISYFRRDVDTTTDYTILTQEDFQSSLDNRLETTVSILSFTTTQEAEVYHVSLSVSYEKENQNYLVWEEIFVTDKYLFTMIYAKGGNSDWDTAFEEAVSNLKLESVASLEDGNP